MKKYRETRKKRQCKKIGFMFSLVHSSHISGRRCVRHFRKKLEHEEFKNWEKTQMKSEVE